MPKSHRTPPSAPPPEVVDPRWLLKALGIVLAAAVLCAYIAICMLFVRSQWQLAVTPTRTVAQTPAAIGLPFTAVSFGTDSSGQPQLTGWWVPAGSPQARTVLVLHGGSGSLANTLPTAQLLHAAGLNALFFDYRGFGLSGGKHPTQTLMQEDAASALNYLVDMRHFAASGLVIFGQGVGASLAVQLCEQHPELHALILEDADGDIDRRLSSDPRAGLVPAHLLFDQTFSLAEPLSKLRTPKLLITHTNGTSPAAAFQSAADPKITLEIPPDGDPKMELDAVERFLPDTPAN